MNISVVGTGYVGLVSGACLASKGHETICIDVDKAKVEQINSGVAPIYEEGLPEILSETIGKKLRADTNLREAILNTELSLIAVGTPYKGDQIDLSYVRQAAAEIGRVLADKDSYHVVVVKSTVVPGTTEDVVLPILEETSGKKAGQDFGVGMNPEFLREGCAVADFLNPDRIVLGGIDERTLGVMKKLYQAFPDTDIVTTNPKTAEMIKYTANGLLATMISFSNEIANLSAKLGGIDVTEVMRGVHLDKRLSPILDNGCRITPGLTQYLAAGCGFGGSCFPKDVRALIAHGKKYEEPMSLLEAVVKINAQQPNRMLELLRKHFRELRGLKVSVLGLAFKPGTNDIRESPAIPILHQLQKEGAVLTAFDPVAEHEMRHLFNDSAVRYTRSLAEAVRGADAVLLITNWPEFSELPRLLASNTVLIDGRRAISKDAVPRYEGIGLS